MIRNKRVTYRYGVVILQRPKIHQIRLISYPQGLFIRIFKHLGERFSGSGTVKSHRHIGGEVQSYRNIDIGGRGAVSQIY